MKTVISIITIIGIIVLGYLLYDSIREPIAFKNEKEKREQAVINKLKKIREVQEVYRAVTGDFAGNFDSLKHVIRTGQIPILKVEGDPDDPTGGEFTVDTLYFSAADSVESLGINLDSLQYVPYSSGATFDISADTMTYQQTLVNVVEVGVQRKKFMGKYADARFAKYDNSYDPDSKLKFGNMESPNTAGNWE
ncbi:MAG: hypothetical protein R3275_05180 [Saprospiraceae bacterium]|nr:hypothetical protein [Saprospiraceae bacterium]